MRRIWIVGAGGFAVEAYSWLLDVLNTSGGGEVAGFLQDGGNPTNILERIGVAAGRYPVLEPDAFTPGENDECLCAVGTPKAKLALVPRLKAKGARFMTLVHPGAVVGANVSLGEGSVVCPLAVLGGCAAVGAFATINFHASMGHDTSLGDYSVLSPYAAVLGRCRVGSRTLLGARAVIRPGVNVGDDAVVGLGAVVVNRVRNGRTVFGNPAVVVAINENEAER